MFTKKDEHLKKKLTTKIIEIKYLLAKEKL